MIKRYWTDVVFDSDDNSIMSPVDSEIAEDVSELLDDGIETVEDNGESEEESETEEPEPEVKPKGEEPAEGEEEEEFEETDEAEIEEEVEDGKVDEEEPSELEQAQAQIDKLTELVEKLSGGEVVVEKSKAKEEEKVETPEPKPVTPEAPQELKDVLEGLDFNAAMETKEGFLTFFVKAMTAVQEQTKQQVLSSIPNVVGGYVQRQAVMRDVASEFYKTHPELKRVKRYVGKVANEISANDPSLGIAEVLEKAAEVAKETLNIKSTVESNDRKKKVKPTLPGSKSVKQPKKPVSGLQNDIDDLLND